MRIGIVTFHFSDNYGALLQAYALRSWLRAQGHDADFVNYVPRHVEGGGTWRWPTSVSAIKANAKTAFLTYSKVKQQLVVPAATKRALHDFITQDLGVVGPRYRTRAELGEACLTYDCLICGSDQIWSPSLQFGVDPVYYLDFDCSTRRRVSYAPSFGSSHLAAEHETTVARLISRLDAVSVREEGSVATVARLTGRAPACVPDPTFLLDDYKALLQGATPASRKTIFSYILRTNQGVPQALNVLKCLIQAEIVSGYNPHRRWRESGETIYGGPREWLAGLASSEFVLTNSFHATVFSILLSKPFIALRLPGRRRPLSERIEHLLSEVGLSERIVDADDLLAIRRLASTPIDWQATNQHVERLRLCGREYLAKAV